MATIALVVCAVCSLSASVGGGLFFVQTENDRKRIKTIEDNVGKAAAMVIYSECDYKGKVVVSIDVAPDGEFNTMNMNEMDPPGKSFILPPGIKLGAYSKSNQEGVKLPYNGPTFQRCTDIKSLEAESGCDPSRPGGCEITI
jgi:hypothetical protein